MSLLNQVQRGRKLKPLALMLHAPHGIGKSTFATEAPNPIYVGNEENDELDIARMPRIKKWSDFIDQLSTLLNEKHDYKTLVIDTIDGLEQVAELQILSAKEAKGKSMATAFGGYGKAYSQMKNMFLHVKDDYLSPLRDIKGMNIIILCHSNKVKFEDTMLSISYDHYETAIHKGVKGIFEDWVSAILFANYYLVRSENNSGKEYAQGLDGLRMIYTEERPSHVAKNRFNLPYEIEFKKEGTWNVIRNYILDYFSTSKKEEIVDESILELKDKIKRIITELPEELKASVNASFARAKTKEELERILTKAEKITAQNKEK